MSEATLKSAEIPAKCNLFRVLTESLWERLLCCNVTSGCGGWIPLQIKPNCTAFKVTALFFFLLLAPFESPTGHKHTTLWQKTQFVFALLGSGEWGSNIIMLVYRWCAEVCYMNSCHLPLCINFPHKTVFSNWVCCFNGERSHMKRWLHTQP